jgi:hypothetical protein
MGIIVIACLSGLAWAAYNYRLVLDVDVNIEQQDSNEEVSVEQMGSSQEQLLIEIGSKIEEVTMRLSRVLGSFSSKSTSSVGLS